MGLPFSIWTILEVLLITMIVGIVFVILSENRKPQKTLSWILVLICLPVVGVLLYFIFGREHRKKHSIYKKLHRGLKFKDYPSPDINISRTHPEEYEKLVSMFSNINDAPLLSGNKIDFFASGKDKFKQLFIDIENASSHIHILYYKILDDKIGNELKDLLIRKAKQGLEVRVIYDDVGSIWTRKRFFREMENEGIEVEPYLEVRLPWIAQRANYRNHRKIAVIDGKIGYTGGMNVGDCYVDGLRWGKWKDIQIRIEGNGAKGLQKVFLSDWYLSRKEIPQAGNYFPEMPDSGEKPLQIVSSGPIDAYNSIEKGIIQAINSAQKSIYIQTPYFMPSESVLTALQTSSASGIEINIMLPEKSDSYFVDRTTHSYIKDLLEYNIKVYLYNGGFLHTKSIIVDDSLVSIGSANMDVRSFELSFETNAFIYDKNTALSAKDIFLEDTKESSMVRKQKWNKRPLWIRFIESIMRLFTPIF